MDPVRTSKLLSRILRHDPAAVGISLDPAGWVPVDTLLAGLRAHGHRLSRDELARLVAASDKQRFAIDATTDRIRAQQGHSVPVDLGLPPAVPPPLLYHGTAVGNVEAILGGNVEAILGGNVEAILGGNLGRSSPMGLHRGGRHDVHLSPDPETAHRVGARRGRHVVLVVRAGAMHADGYRFSVSGNGVWLTREVPARYLSRSAEHRNGGSD